MVTKKNVRQKGKIPLSRYFKKFEKGDRVAVVLEKSLNPKIPKRIQGRAGVIENKRGDAYVVKIKNKNELKMFLIKPIHLKKLN